MQEDRLTLQYCQDHLPFGMLTDTPNINFVPAIDLDQSIFYIPYTRPNITIQQLLEEYKTNTKCLKMYKNQPYLRIQQGSRLNQIAQPQQTLASLELDQNEICFHLIDLSWKEAEVQFNKGEGLRGNSQNQFVVKVYHDVHKYHIRVNSEMKVIALKKLLIQQIPELKNRTADQIEVMSGGFFLTQDTSSLRTNNINMYSKLLVKVKKIQELNSYYIKVRFPTGDIFDFPISPSDYIRTLKEKIEESYFINVHNQKLLYIGQQLQNQQTFSDKNIQSGFKIVLIFKNNDCFNRVREGTSIMVAGEKEVPVQNLKEGDKILTIDPLAGTLTLEQTIESIEEYKVKDFMIFSMDTYDRANEIVMGPDCYLLCQNGQVLHTKDLCYQFYLADQLPRLRKIKGGAGVIKGIAHDEHIQKNPKQFESSRIFYKINTISASDFVVKHYRMCNNVLSVVVKEKNKRIHNFIIPASSVETIGQIRQKIIKLKKCYSQLDQYDFGNLTFFFEEEELKDELTLEHYNIEAFHSILAIVKSKVSITLTKSAIITAPEVQDILEEKLIEIQISPTQKHTVKYIDNKDRTVEEIIKQLTPNYSSSYFFIFANIYLFPTDTLSKMELEVKDFLICPDITILMIKCEKVAFLQKMNIKKEQIKNHSAIYSSSQDRQYVSSASSMRFQQEEHEFFQDPEVKRAARRIENDQTIKDEAFKSDSFYNPFLFLTSRRYSNEIYDYIKKFKEYKDKYNQNMAYFTIIKDIYINLQLLPNYYGECFMGLNNFKFSRYFSELNTFYLHSFTIAFQSKEKVMKEVERCRGPSSIFQIRSLNGRKISKFSFYPEANEIMFSPFTPFLVEKIQSKDHYDYVYLVELSSPISFKKDIVLWVDDEPKGNIQQINQIYKTEEDIEILQATSTIEAEKWIQQFGWLVNWKGLEFKLVSDMRRVEGVGEDRVENKRAGIDLLIQLYNKHGVTVRTLIFCFKEDEAKQLAKEANLQKDKYYEITKKPSKLYNFIKKNKSQ